MRQLFQKLFPVKTYMRAGYRWFELRLGRRAWITWQIPFFRPYSIAWTQARIDADVEQVKAQFQAGLMSVEDFRKIALEERYDIG